MQSSIQSKISNRLGSPLRASLLAGLSIWALAACSNNSSHGVVVPVAAPVFLEAEPNDDVFNANYFGELYAGDLFYIDGFISDDGFDPFDGFAFTAGDPVHVDFRLFIDDVLADFDVCLYDPQLDLVLACYESSNNPEAGGVDIFYRDLDFHLVVESFAGSGTYSLEIDVQPLIFNSTLERSNQGLAPTYPLLPILAAGSEVSGAKNARGAAAFDAYRNFNKAERPSPTVTHRRIDSENGSVIETTTVE